MKKKQNQQPGSKKAGRFLTPRVRRKEALIPTDGPIPRITNESISEHREEVLAGARKYIYPLQHSRHKVVLITSTILLVVFISLMTYTLLSLYKFQSTSPFLYQVTKIVPLPVARVGGSFISYENYLFELNRYIHYFENQQKLDFSTDQGKSQLEDQRQKALDKVVTQTYVQKIAREKGLKVSSAEIDAQLETLKSQNRLGNDSKVFEDVLRDYWGWSVSDFRRTIASELLAQKVLQSLDTDTKGRADAALAELKAGKDFAAVAKQYSDDAVTKEKGGDLGVLISRTDRSIPAQTTDALFKLKPGEISGIVDVGYGLEIIKNLGLEGDKAKAGIIFFNFKDLNKFIDDYKDKQKATVYIRV